VMLGVAVLGNQLTTATLVGGILIAAAVLLIQWNSTRLETTASQRAVDAALPQ
jgi:drug/metabolite transporter (DMT)-like permease